MADPPAGCRSSLRRVGSTCCFRDDPGRACAIHRDYGEKFLPSACRQFPRVCVLEPGVVSVSLSHYCPTAAALLFGSDPRFEVVSAPAAFPSTWPFEGLDARDSYPPFLRPGVLLGFDGLRAFEERAIEALSTGRLTDALSAIDLAVEGFRSWTPTSGPLPDRISRSFVRSTGASLPEVTPLDPREILAAALTEGTVVTTPLPEFHAGSRLLPDIDLALRKYLASRLIGAWIMFQGEDLRSVVRFLRLCLDTAWLFEAASTDTPAGPSRWKEAIRSADLWLLHYCDPARLARELR